MALVTLAPAQEKQERMRDRLSPEQRAELRTKRMALTLDLNENQQRDLLKLNGELGKQRQEKFEKYRAMREKGQKLSAEERFAHMNALLDEQLAVQKQMKKILNEDQYLQWRKMRVAGAKKRRDFVKRRMRMHRQKR